MPSQDMVSVMSIGGDKRTDQTGLADKTSEGVRRISMVPTTTNSCPASNFFSCGDEHVCTIVSNSGVPSLDADSGFGRLEIRHQSCTHMYSTYVGVLYAICHVLYAICHEFLSSPGATGCTCACVNLCSVFPKRT